MLLSYFLCFLLPHITVYTEGCFSPIVSLSNLVTESFVPSLPQIDPIAQVLPSCTNITRTHFIIGVKSSHCFQIHIICGDHVISEKSLSISKRLVSGLKVGSNSYLRHLFIIQIDLQSVNIRVSLSWTKLNRFSLGERQSFSLTPEGNRGKNICIGLKTYPSDSSPNKLVVSSSTIQETCLPG
jgi:hypothetical protein